MEKIQRLQAQISILQSKLDTDADKIGTAQVKWYALNGKINKLKKELQELKWKEYLAK